MHVSSRRLIIKKRGRAKEKKRDEDRAEPWKVIGRPVISRQDRLKRIGAPPTRRQDHSQCIEYPRRYRAKILPDVVPQAGIRRSADPIDKNLRGCYQGARATYSCTSRTDSSRKNAREPKTRQRCMDGNSGLAAASLVPSGPRRLRTSSSASSSKAEVTGSRL